MFRWNRGTEERDNLSFEGHSYGEMVTLEQVILLGLSGLRKNSEAAGPGNQRGGLT